MAIPKMIYVWEQKDGEFCYMMVGKSIGDIPEEQDGKKIGLFKLDKKLTFRVKREISLE